MPINDAFEMLMKIFDGQGTQFVKDPADFHTSRESACATSPIS
jgi:hypothetical protein